MQTFYAAVMTKYDDINGYFVDSIYGRFARKAPIDITSLKMVFDKKSSVGSNTLDYEYR